MRPAEKPSAARIPKLFPASVDGDPKRDRDHEHEPRHHDRRDRDLRIRGEHLEDSVPGRHLGVRHPRGQARKQWNRREQKRRGQKRVAWPDAPPLSRGASSMVAFALHPDLSPFRDRGRAVPYLGPPTPKTFNFSDLIKTCPRDLYAYPGSDMPFHGLVRFSAEQRLDVGVEDALPLRIRQRQRSPPQIPRYLDDRRGAFAWSR